MISTHWSVCRILISVAVTASAMPTAAIKLPRTAVLGPVRPIKP